MIHSLSTDFLIRIKNGYRAGRKSIKAPASKFCISIANLLKKNGYIANYTISGDVIKELTIDLIYTNGEAKVTDVRLYSKPGRRFYSNAIKLPWGKTPSSIIIVSTSSGLMTQKQAQVKGLGGEIIAEIF